MTTNGSIRDMVGVDLTSGVQSLDGMTGSGEMRSPLAPRGPSFLGGITTRDMTSQDVDSITSNKIAN